MKTIIEKIQYTIDSAKSSKLPLDKITLEYNFEVPKGLKADDFYGVKARFNSMVTLGECKIIYSY